MGRSLVPLLPALYSVFSVVWQLDKCVLLSPWSSYVSGINCVLNDDPNTCHCQKLCAKFEDDIFTDVLNVLFLKHTRSPIAYSTCHINFTELMYLFASAGLKTISPSLCLHSFQFSYIAIWFNISMSGKLLRIASQIPRDIRLSVCSLPCLFIWGSCPLPLS